MVTPGDAPHGANERIFDGTDTVHENSKTLNPNRNLVVFSDDWHVNL